MPPPPKKKQKRKTITITNYNTTNNIQTLPKYNYTTLVNKSNATTWTSRIKQNARNDFWWFKRYDSLATNNNPNSKFLECKTTPNHMQKNLHKNNK